MVPCFGHVTTVHHGGEFEKELLWIGQRYTRMPQRKGNHARQMEICCSDTPLPRKHTFDPTARYEHQETFLSAR
jgi:hypothetical protein